MKVQILSKNGEIVWSYDVAAQIDKSGDSWRNGNHELMAGVTFSLRRTLEQAEVLPEESNWIWPFSIIHGSNKQFRQVARQVALEEPLKVACELCQACHQHHNNSTDQSCRKQTCKNFAAADR